MHSASIIMQPDCPQLFSQQDTLPMKQALDLHTTKPHAPHTSHEITWYQNHYLYTPTSHRGTTWVLLNKNVAFNQNTVTQGETPTHRLICVAVPSSLSLSHGHTTSLCLSPSTTCFTHHSTFSRWHPSQTSHCLARPTLLQITDLYVMYYSDTTVPIRCMATFRNNRQ
jgi:hypothetical protein